MKLLGPDWGFVMTDVTLGDLGNNERMAFIFDTTRVKPSGLACELVVPETVTKKKVVSANAFQHQFARTPYAVSFLSSGKTFILVTLHVHYATEKTAQKRIPELKAIAEWLADWVKRSNSFGHNLMALGDFNIDRVGDCLYDAFTSTGLYTPEDLNKVPRTIFYADPENPQKEKHYDQIAWFNGKNKVPRLTLEYNKGGYVNFKETIMKTLSENEISWRMSDHFPLWVEFLI